MPHPFGNDIDRFGSAAFVTEAELKKKGFFKRTPTSIYIGEFNGRALWYDGPGGVLLTAGARSGKLRDILGVNVLSGTLSEQTLVILDPKGKWLTPLTMIGYRSAIQFKARLKAALAAKKQ